MARMIFRELPNKETLISWFRQNCPEVDAECIYAHTFIRALTANIENSVETFLARFGISSGRFQVMLMLEFSATGMKPSEIANTIGVTQATITGLLDGLEAKEFVKRMDCQDDRRACIVGMTEKGKQFMSQARPEFNRWIGAAYGGISAAEREQLISLLMRVQKALSA